MRRPGAAVVVLALLLAGCDSGDGGGGNGVPTGPTAPAPVVVSLGGTWSGTATWVPSEFKRGGCYGEFVRGGRNSRTEPIRIVFDPPIGNNVFGVLAPGPFHTERCDLRGNIFEVAGATEKQLNVQTACNYRTERTPDFSSGEGLGSIWSCDAHSLVRTSLRFEMSVEGSTITGIGWEGGEINRRAGSTIAGFERISRLSLTKQ